VETQKNEFIVIKIKSKDIRKVRKATAHDASDIRMDEVEHIKQAIADGSFHVDSHDLAEKVLQEVITESIFLD
jgi:flagellar biosynthesis anti-sigma factor FlgM